MILSHSLYIRDKQKRKVTKVFLFFLFFRFMRSALLPRSDMVCSCMSLTFGILVLLCPFGLTRPVFLLATGAIYMLSRGRVKLFATEENVAKQEEEEEEEEEGEKEEESETELRVRGLFFFFLFVFTQGALNYK